MTPPACATQTRLYEKGKVVAEDFGAEQAPRMLAERPGAVLWLDLYDPDEADLAAVAAEFHLHALAIEDAVQDHERPKFDRYPDHLFVNLYAVEVATESTGQPPNRKTSTGQPPSRNASTGQPSHRNASTGQPPYRKTEISAFVTERALITVRKSRGDTAAFVQRWDADAELAASGGVAFLLYGLLDVVVDGHMAAAQQLDVAMDGVEDALLEEGGAPRPVRMHGLRLRKTVALLRRAVAPMPDVVGETMRTDVGLVDDNLRPYYRDVEDHAKHTYDQVEHLSDRIEGLLQADLAEQSNVLNDITRKLAAWAAVIAVPTALTGYFGQNVPYPGYGKFSGFLQSASLLIVSAGGLYLYLKRRGWL